MKIGVAQTKPVRGDIPANIHQHQLLTSLAGSSGAGLIVFPELSLTGYEPGLAKQLACELHDTRLDVLQQESNLHGIIICAGMPVKTHAGVSIGMLIFQPFRERSVYYKKFLHQDELPFFVSENSRSVLALNDVTIGLAICYELSVPEHAKKAFDAGAGIYIASVAKTKKGTISAIERLSAIAKEYKIPVLYSNCTGVCDGEEMAGRSSAWDGSGQLVGQMDETAEGILLFDTVANTVLCLSAGQEKRFQPFAGASNE